MSNEKLYLYLVNWLERGKWETERLELGHSLYVSKKTVLGRAVDDRVICVQTGECFNLDWILLSEEIETEPGATKQAYRDIDNLLASGNKAQREKLLENSHKHPWSVLSLSYLEDLLDEEYRELKDELTTKYPDWGKTKYEAADLANICHFIIEHCNNIENEV